MTPRVLAFAVLLAASASLQAQMMRVDAGRRIGNLWVFPLADRPHAWVYLPSRARLSTDEHGNPEFSLIRYAKATPASDGPETITEADGGGVLHLLALYDTPESAVTAARRELQEVEHDEDLTLTGPVVFSSGRYAVISSVLSMNGSGTTPQLLSTGAAPVLEGNRIALSFPLDRTAASLLLQSFRMANPDVSITFDMEFAGVGDPYDATIDVDWSEVRHHEKFAAGVKIYYVGADVKVAIDELRRDGAIKVNSRGESASMEGLLNAAYTKIADLLFRPAPSDEQAPAPSGDILSSLLGLVGGGSSTSALPFSLYGSYELKDFKSSGHTVVSLNHQSAVKRHAMLTVNIGELWTRYGGNPAYFRAVRIGEDPVFQQRRIAVSVDGSLLPEFRKFINSATISVRKKHQDGRTTLGEAVITKNDVEKLFSGASAGPLALMYGYFGDDDREAWLRYEFRTRWSFQGGNSYETPWTAADASMISVFAPYERRTVQVIGTPDVLKSRKVTYAVVRVSYPFFGSTKTQQMTYRVGADPIDAMFDLTLPSDQFTTHITTTWHFADGKEAVVARDDSSGMVLLDEVPQS